MKTLQYILLAILLGINLASCEAPPIQDEVGVEETISLTGEDSGGSVESQEEN